MSRKFPLSKCLFVVFALAIAPTIIVQAQDERLSKEEIERLNREADEAAKRDQNPELAKSFRARNELEKYAYSLLTTLDEGGDGLSEKDKQVVNDAAMDTIKWIETNLHAPLADYQTRRRQLEEKVEHIMGQLEEVIDFDKDEL